MFVGQYTRLQQGVQESARAGLALANTAADVVRPTAPTRVKNARRVLVDVPRRSRRFPLVFIVYSNGFVVGCSFQRPD